MKRQSLQPKRGSVVDLILILLFLLCAAALLLRGRELNTTSGESLSTYTVTARIPSLDARTAECISEGAHIYDASGTLIGTIRGIEKKPASFLILSNGEYHSAFWDAEVRCDVVLTFSVQGTGRNGELLLAGRIPWIRGQQLTFYTDLCTLNVKLYNFTSEGS